MGWIPLDKTDTALYLPFLMDKEYACIAATSRIMEWKNSGKRPAPFYGYIHTDKQEKPDGLLFFTKEGLAVPFFGGSGEVSNTFEPERLLDKIPSNLHSIIGTAADVEIVNGILRKVPKWNVDFKLMTALPLEIPIKPVPPGLSLHPAGPQDADTLFPLQKEYELEEVVLDPSRFNSRASLEHFRVTLRKQIVLYALFENFPVAKAGTNAKGYSYYQLGGVFTFPDFRCRGIGKTIITRLCAELAKANKKVSLFVKTSNIPARRLYESLGFINREDFRITYIR